MTADEKDLGILKQAVDDGFRKIGESDEKFSKALSELKSAAEVSNSERQANKEAIHQFQVTVDSRLEGQNKMLFEILKEIRSRK